MEMDFFHHSQSIVPAPNSPRPSTTSGGDQSSVGGTEFAFPSSNVNEVNISQKNKQTVHNEDKY